MPGALEFCLADIGLLLPEDTDPKSKGVFRHEKRFYRLIFERGFVMHQVPALLRDVKRLPEYSLRWRTDASDEASVFLSLFMRFLLPEELGDFGCAMQRQRMVALFFRELERRDFVRMGELQLRELTGDGEPLSVNEFYERLRVGHEEIHACCRKERMEKATIEEGNLFLAYLEALKDEFKHYSKYWVEINYAAAAFDELNMCRSRLQVITMEDLDQAGGKKSIQQILDYEVHETFEDLQVQKVTAEREFVRLKGTLKYLQHLGSVAEIDVCPICQCQPEERYAVLQCGHHFCIVCAPQLVRIARSQGNNVTCGVCRHKQQIADLYFVTCGQVLPAKQDINVRGNYSNKILKIVETVLQLKLDEPDVKIIIFSHWDPILFYLAQALDTNSVTYRLKSTKFYKHIEEFKDYTNGITCLLLPLKAGSKGLNLTEATHVFLVEPILNPGEELQAVGRVHRIGQTKPTFVHRFIVQNTIEETIHRTVQADRTGRWSSKDVTVEHLEQLFQLEEPEQIELFAE